MDKFRRLTFLAWFALFPLLFIGYGGAEAGILCIDTHHVNFEAANYGRGAVAFPVEPRGPVDERHGDHCLDIPLSIGDIQPAVYKIQQTNLPSWTPDIAGVWFTEQAFVRRLLKFPYSPQIVRNSGSHTFLISVILLI